MERSQFTFYRSYYDAIKVLPKKEQTAVILAICAYALDNEEPKLTGTASAIFTLVRPTLDSGRKKAIGGMKGTPKKDIEKISERPAKDKAKEKEKEKEKENECYKPLPLLDGVGPDLQKAFEDWVKYKTERKEKYTPTGLAHLKTEVKNNAARCGEAAVAELIRKCMASGWRGIIFEKLAESPKAKNGPTYTIPSAAQNERAKRDMDNIRSLMQRINNEGEEAVV
ncbi:MAG: hypothetical protein IKU94_00840 [Bacteroidaceae bacterium]|nr:hypothetical protein [Bacteroidaceae bacterium]MBR4930418.1 hypothetical protein [Bacteroidaceae bacterium]